MDATYLFIDGKNLFERLEKYWDEVYEAPFYWNFIDLEVLGDAYGATRAYYYLSEHDGRECTLILGSTQVGPMMFPEYIERTPKFHLRQGTLTKPRSPSRPPSQKEVDVLMTVDALKAAYDGVMKKAVILSDRIDFRPLVESLVAAGVLVTVVGWENRTQELRGVADSVSFIDDSWINGVLEIGRKSQYPLISKHAVIYEGTGISSAKVEMPQADGTGTSIVHVVAEKKAWLRKQDFHYFISVPSLEATYGCLKLQPLINYITNRLNVKLTWSTDISNLLDK